MGLGSFRGPPDDDAIDQYRDKDIEATVSRTNQLPHDLLSAKAPSRRKHMLTVLKWVLAYTDNGYALHPAKLEAFERTADAYDLDYTSTLATEIQQAYRHRKQGDGVQDLFEDGLQEFLDIWEQQETYC